jgi:hypothetical protein
MKYADTIVAEIEKKERLLSKIEEETQRVVLHR